MVQGCLAGLAMTAALGACSKPGGPVPDLAPAAPIALESYCADYAQLACDLASACGCLGGIPESYCMTYEKGQCHDDVEAPVEQGRRAYDAQAAGDCLDGLRSLVEGCSIVSFDYPAACDAMLIGQVQPGGACQDSGDCVDGLECLGGLCRSLPSEGQACDPQYDCASSLYCGSDGRCHAPGGPGAACPEGSMACADELYCDPRDSVCAPLLGEGDGCGHATWACGDGLYCSSASQLCLRYPGPGQSCADSYGECADGSTCGTDSVCHAQLPTGASCTSDSQCLSDTCSSGSCQAENDDVCSAV